MKRTNIIMGVDSKQLYYSNKIEKIWVELHFYLTLPAKWYIIQELGQVEEKVEEKGRAM